MIDVNNSAQAQERYFATMRHAAWQAWNDHQYYRAKVQVYRKWQKQVFPSRREQLIQKRLWELANKKVQRDDNWELMWHLVLAQIKRRFPPQAERARDSSLEASGAANK